MIPVKNLSLYAVLIITLFTNSKTIAEENNSSANTQTLAPWAGASVTETAYKPQKVVYDVHIKTVKEVESVLDRASYLSTITGADPFEQSIVLVLHGDELNFFAIKNYNKY